MGACAGCMGPSRRDQNYKVNRLTENAPIKNRVSSSELPVNKYRDQVVTQLLEQKRRIDSRQDLRIDPNNLINTLRQSPQISSSSYKQQQKLSSSTILYKDRDPNESLFMKQSLNNQSLFMGRSMKKSESGIGMADQNSGLFHTLGYQRISSDRKYTIQGRTPIVSQFKASAHASESGKHPLSEVGLNKSTDFGTYTKRKELLNIPQLPQQQSRTPHYVRQMRKQNGEDVLRTGLAGIPKKLETAPSANLYKYLKDLQ